MDAVASEMMETANEQLGITEQIAHSSERLDAYMKIVNDNSESVAESAKALEEQSGKLSESMNHFTV